LAVRRVEGAEGGEEIEVILGSFDVIIPYKAACWIRRITL
jgi:hypothetical protein